MSSKSKLIKNRNRFGYIFILPWLIGFLRLFLYPLIKSVILSFQSVEFNQGQSGYNATYSGLQNYIDALTVDEKFITYIGQTLLDLLINVPVILVFSFFVAVLLKQKFRGNFIVKSIFFLPIILGTGVFLQISGDAEASAEIMGAAAQEELQAMDTFSKFNIIDMLTDIGLPEQVAEYINGPVERIFSLIMLSGVQIFIFLAGLNSISPSLYEAANVEGASGWEAFWKITLPMVSPSIIINVVFSIIDTFTVSTNITMDYIEKTAFTNFDFGLSSAMSWIYCTVLTLILAVIMMVISKRVVYEA